MSDRRVEVLPSRRRVLTAVGASALGSLAGYATADDRQEVTTIRVDGSETRVPISVAIAEEAESVSRGVAIDVEFSGTERAVERFVDGELDVLHADRPLLPAEAGTATENGVAYRSHEAPVDGVATLVHHERTWETCLDEEGRAAVRDGSETETWSELVPDEVQRRGSNVKQGGALVHPSGRTGLAVRDDYAPGAGTALLVRGIRAHQYARGFGGVGHYAIDPDRVLAAPAVDGVDHTPLVRLRFSYVNVDSLESEPVRAFVRRYAKRVRTLTDGVQYFATTAGDTQPYAVVP